MSETPNEEVEHSTASDAQKISVMFICTANVCRSPTAHGVFQDFVDRAGLSEHFLIESAGTNVRDPGKVPEARAQKVAQALGYSLSGLSSRTFEQTDFDEYDYIIGMDRTHIEKLEAIRPPQHTGTVRLLLSYANYLQESEVPDPYYGAMSDFRIAMQLIEQGCISLLEALVAKHNGLLSQ
ncbi:MAG: low molecular weight protein-tyrosine-phosphatase [Pseudomonadota bacterium]